MAKRKTNIIGLTFRCEDCGKTFAIGKNGVDAALIRAQKHMIDNLHMNIAPVNPPKGLTYKSIAGTVEVVFDGKDAAAFIKSIKKVVSEQHCAMIPQMKLAKV